MILNILVTGQRATDEVEASSELRLEADSFLIRPAHILYKTIEGKDEKVAICPESSIMMTNNPPEKLPFWLVSHKDQVYCFQNAFLTNKEGKTVQRYG